MPAESLKDPPRWRSRSRAVFDEWYIATSHSTPRMKVPGLDGGDSDVNSVTGYSYLGLDVVAPTPDDPDHVLLERAFGVSACVDLEGDGRGAAQGIPEEPLDLDLVDRVLVAAMDEVESVDVVVMPESAIEETDIAPLEALLDGHGVIYFQAGVRGKAVRPGEFGSNRAHR